MNEPAEDERTAFAPITRRIDALDVARGIALFGILVVNVQTFGGPFPWAAPDPYDHGVDRIVYALTDAFFASKFFPLFSLLFGLSARLQLDRAEASGLVPSRFFARRMAVLLGIGIVHATVLSTIDILVPYALLGFALPFLARRSDRFLVGVAVVCLAVPVAVMGVLVASGKASEVVGHLPDAHALIADYGGHDLARFVARRFRDLRGYGAWVLSYSGWVSAAMIALGATAKARDLAHDLEGGATELARMRRLGFGLGLPFALLHAALFLDFKTRGLHDPRLLVASSATAFVEEPALALAYAASAASLATRGAWPRATAALARLGRLSLTSYVAQSVVMNLVFFGFGLGLYGRVRPVHLLGFVALTFAGQLAFARAVLARHAQGPLEALWRRLTYGAGTGRHG